MKNLKSYRKRAAENNSPCFQVLYTFEGRIYIKRSATDDKNDAICVSSKKRMHDLISEYVDPQQESSNQSWFQILLKIWKKPLPPTAAVAIGTM